MLPESETSLWIATTSDTEYPQLEHDSRSYDVVVIGGGITGILTAWLLQKEGVKTVIIEKDKIVKNTTGHTTAKLTSQHYLIYQYLVRNQGRETAKMYATANEEAINDIERITEQEAIDCDFKRTDAYVYAQTDSSVEEIRREVEVTQELGLPSSYETSTDLPFKVKAAVKFSNQAEFHPRKFLLPLAELFIKAGGKIYEQTKAKDIETGLVTHTVVTEQGKLKAKYVVEATKYPFWQPKLFEEAYWTKLSYALGVLIEGDYPRGMYITTDDPIRTIRSHPYKEGRMLIFGGESHKMEKGFDKNEHYTNLGRDVQSKFEVERIVYKWIAGDAMSNDMMPFIGEYPDHPNIFISSGYRAWGLAWAMAAAKLLSSYIQGEPLEWGKPFKPARVIKK